MATGLYQLISLLLTLLVVYALISVTSFVNWKKKNDIELSAKLDKILELMSENKGS